MMDGDNHRRWSILKLLLMLVAAANADVVVDAVVVVVGTVVVVGGAAAAAAMEAADLDAVAIQWLCADLQHRRHMLETMSRNG